MLASPNIADEFLKYSFPIAHPIRVILAVTTSVPPSNLLRVAVLSDLHAYDTIASTESKPSFYCINDDIMDTPIGDLQKLIDETGMEADLLVCPGDLGHQANGPAIRSAWSQVHDIGTRLKVKLVAGTVGNHDVDSRYLSSDYDPKEHLQNLSPPFPLPDESSNNVFWARNFEIVVGESYRLVVLNSSAFHGSGENEYECGRISPPTLDRLKARLSEIAPRPVNILLCHHHPQKHMEVKLGEYDEIKSGQLLLEMLGSGEFGNWIVVHGHKHHPKLCYSHGGSAAPVIFSAGSLCHVLFPELNTVAGRQFYVLQFPIDQFDDFGFVGTFQAWEWEFKRGWARAPRKKDLPDHGGFGYRFNLEVLAKQIADWIGARVLGWDVFLLQFPQYLYLLPRDSRLLDSVLASRHSVQIQFDEDDQPVQIGSST